MAELEVAFGGYSSAGRKPDNEDAFAALQPSRGTRRTKGVVAAIADGVSSCAGAQKASNTAVTQFIEDYLATPESWTVKSAAARVISALNRWLFQHGHSDASLVTTFSALIVKSSTAHLLHVGDGRIARLRGGSLQQLTREHRTGTYLTRALGLDVALDVDYLTEEVRPGDLYVLTTDGVHDWLTSHAMVERLAAVGCLESAARNLVDDALANGGDDNASCLLVRVDALPRETIDEAHRRLTQQVIPPALSPGAVFDGYRVVRVLFEGPRSHLYLVEATNGRYFALKTPSINFADDPEYLERFTREQWIGQRLDHPGIVRYFPRIDETPFQYALLEYVSGRTLRQWIFDHPSPPLQEVRRLIEEIARAVRAMHRLQMVHCDLKPENIMIDDDGRVRIVDLGAVHVAGFDESSAAIRDSAPTGSVGYVAPECLRGEPATALSDLFALGVIAYEMLTGHLPYRTPLAAQDPGSYSGLAYIPAKQLRADVPKWIDVTLSKAVARTPADRYQALSEFLADLQRPNQAMLDRIASAPLIERHPVMFWKVTSLVLLVLVIVSIAARF